MIFSNILLLGLYIAPVIVELTSLIEFVDLIQLASLFVVLWSANLFPPRLFQRFPRSF